MALRRKQMERNFSDFAAAKFFLVEFLLGFDWRKNLKELAGMDL